jgi:hypothetical protein
MSIDRNDASCYMSSSVKTFFKIKKCLRIVFQSLVILGFTPFLSYAENGAPRGGGNAMACFRASATTHFAGFIQEMSEEARTIGHVLGVAQVIPDWRLRFLDKIETVELNSHITSVPPRVSRLPVSLSEWKDGEGSQALENEYEWLVSRYRQGIPKIAQALNEAQQALSAQNLQLVDHAVSQVSDSEGLVIDQPNCMGSTVFNQWNEAGASVPSWEVDTRLFFHPTESFESQVAAIFHERVYSIARSWRGFQDQQIPRTEPTPI